MALAARRLPPHVHQRASAWHCVLLHSFSFRHAQPPSIRRARTQPWRAIAARSTRPSSVQSNNASSPAPPPTAEESAEQQRQRQADEHFMRMALERAEQAAQQDEIPVGAVLVSQDGAVLACTGNLSHTRGNPVAHAELLAISEAAEKLGGWRLLGTTLYCTLEPCPMCAGAILQARVGRLVYGARQPLLGADGSWVSLFPPEVVEAPREQQAADSMEQQRQQQQGLPSQDEDEAAAQRLQGVHEGVPERKSRRQSRSSSVQPAGATGRQVHPFHRGITVTRGVLAEESAALLKAFFRRRRREQSLSRSSSGGDGDGQPPT